jgi:hypothetical protein
MAAEKDNVRSGFVAGTVVVTVLVLSALVGGVMSLFSHEIEEEIAHKVNEHESSLLRKLRAEEENKLGHYQWVDKKSGVVRIPLDRALELTLRDVASAKSEQKGAPGASASTGSPERSTP